MDKKILVEDIKKVVESFKNEGKDFTFVGLVPVYPTNEKTSYILTVSASWLEKMTPYQSISIITKRLFDVLDKKTLRFVNRVQVLSKSNPFEVPSNNLLYEDILGYNDYENDSKTLWRYQI